VKLSNLLVIMAVTGGLLLPAHAARREMIGSSQPSWQQGNAQTSESYGQWQGRLTPVDRRDFDSYYSRWLDATRRNERDDISSNECKLQEIMARNNIPANTPFDQVASGNPIYPPGAAYPTGQWRGRISAADQRAFDKAYCKWVDASRKGDQLNIQKHSREMQDIMERFNIPANMPFAQIASPDATLH
jgi:hypothetical protein